MAVFSDSKSLIDRLSVELSRYISGDALREAYQQANFGDRIYGYQDIILEAGASMFRTYSGVVHYFDGSVWCPLDDIVLETSVSRAMVSCGVPRRDIVNSRFKILHSAKGGASMSPLGVRGSLVGFRNGVWDFADIDSPVYHPFSDRMPVLSLLPYDYDPSALCPRWESFLRSILPKGDIIKLQKYFGLGCADRKSMPEKIEETLWLVGNGANGKSTVFDVVRGVYGTGNISYLGLDSLLVSSPEVRARFIGSMSGKLFNYCSEVQSDDITRYADTFKSLCSGEPQTMRRLGCNPETTYDIPFLVFNMNQRPANRRMDRAMLRRLLIVPFRTTVSAADMDRGLGAMLSEELPGIRNWMMEGLRMLRRDGYRFSPVSSSGDDEITDYMFENGQSVQVFLEKNGFCCNRRPGRWEDRPQWVGSSDLYGEYLSFCSKWLAEPVSQRSFGGEMTRLGWNQMGGNRKRTSQGYIYGIFCDREIPFALKL